MTELAGSPGSSGSLGDEVVRTRVTWSPGNPLGTFSQSSRLSAHHYIRASQTFSRKSFSLEIAAEVVSWAAVQMAAVGAGCQASIRHARSS